VVNATVLVDSSIWVEVFRPNPPEEVRRILTVLVEAGQAALTEMVRLEVMAGARSWKEFGSFRADFETIPCLETTPRAWRQAEEMSFSLNRAGQRVAAADILISAAAVLHGVPLWHADSDFERVRSVISNFRTFWYPKQFPPDV
jgi:predicted nucleic acid-binding protein